MPNKKKVVVKKVAVSKVAVVKGGKVVPAEEIKPGDMLVKAEEPKTPPVVLAPPTVVPAADSRDAREKGEAQARFGQPPKRKVPANRF